MKITKFLTTFLAIGLSLAVTGCGCTAVKEKVLEEAENIKSQVVGEDSEDADSQDADAGESSQEDAENMKIVLQIDNPVMQVNSEEKNIDDEGTVPVIIDGRTYLPVRAIVEEIGGSVDWDSEAKELKLNYKEDEIKLTIDSTEGYLNGEPCVLDAAPVIANGRTMLPLRIIEQNFGFNIDWNSETKEITLTKE